MPDGTWVAEGALDSWGPGGGAVPVRVEVTIDGDEMRLDLRGSSRQTPGCVNCGLAQTIAAARLAFKFVVNPNMPVTAGSFRNFTVITDERSVFDAREPAACQYYYPHLGLMIDLFLRAMSGAVPDRVVAGQPSDAMNILFTGNYDDGEVFISGEATAVGWGAWSGGDGSNALINYGGGDLKNLPVEVQEVRYPLRVHRYALRADSGGLGRWRGGLGVERAYEVLADDITLSTWFERTTTPGWGLYGAAPGEVSTVVLEQPHSPKTSLLKAAGVAAGRGTRVTVQTGGGGGFGDPSQRPAEEIADDLADGYVTSWPTAQRRQPEGRDIMLTRRQRRAARPLMIACREELLAPSARRRPAWRAVRPHRPTPAAPNRSAHRVLQCRRDDDAGSGDRLQLRRPRVRPQRLRGPAEYARRAPRSARRSPSQWESSATTA